MHPWKSYLLRAVISALSAFLAGSTFSFVVQKLHLALVMKGLKVREVAVLYNIPDFVVDTTILFVLFFGVTFIVVFCFVWKCSAKAFRPSA